MSPARRGVGAPMRARLGIVAAACALGTMAGCGSSAPTAAPSSTTSTNAAHATTTTTTTQPIAVTRPDYAAARTQWEGSWFVTGSALDASYQFAIADLEAGQSSDLGDTDAYAAAIGELNDLSAMLASPSAASADEQREDEAFIDAFFGVAASDESTAVRDDPAGAWFTYAAEAFLEEPRTAADGTEEQPLIACIADLRHAASASGAPVPYGAAIADAEALLASSRTTVIATAADAHSPDGEAIAYLNSFFQRGLARHDPAVAYHLVLGAPTS